MLWLGIGATIGANMAYGAGYRLLGVLISRWPVVAFIGAVGIPMHLVRRSRGPRAATAVPGVPATWSMRSAQRTRHRSQQVRR